MEMLVKCLKQAILLNSSNPSFEAISHADLKNTLPEMAQLQWSLPECSSPIAKISSNGHYLLVLTEEGTVYSINQVSTV